MSENINQLLARLAEVTAERDALAAELAKLREQEPVAWMHDKDGRVDTCHDSVKELWIKVGQKQNTQFMREIVPCRVEHYNIPLYAAPVAAPALPAPTPFIPDDDTRRNDAAFAAIKPGSAAGIMSPMNACMHRDTCRAMLQSAPQVPAAPYVPFTDDDLADIHSLAYELGGTESGEYLLDADQLDRVVVKAASLFTSRKCLLCLRLKFRTVMTSTAPRRT